jgi:hypothetical protein
MKKEDMVCSFDQAEELDNLGLHLSSALYSWRKISRNHNPIRYVLLETGDIFGGYGSIIGIFPAYTVAELMHLLKEYTTCEFVDLRDNQADYLADILINEIKDHQVDPKELKL